MQRLALMLSVLLTCCDCDFALNPENIYSLTAKVGLRGDIQAGGGHALGRELRWIATNTGVNKFDPTTERVTRYLHDLNNLNSIGGE